MKAKILESLREARGYVSGQRLCEMFGVSRTAVWKAINQLKKEGYEIEAVTNRGYHLVSVPDVLSEDELNSIRKTRWAGRRILCYDTLNSTNVEANRLAEQGAAHGTLVIADRQEAGRGRRGREWESPANAGIFMTLLLKPQIEPQNAPMLTLLTALAVAKAVNQVTGLNAVIKWPNDILINGKKICGILTEMSAQPDYVNHIVIGVGINVHNEVFSEELKGRATSIYIESGKHIHRASLIEAVWEAFEVYYEKFLKTQDMSALVPEYDALLANRNQQVRVLDPKDPFEGVAQGITARGELIVDTWEARRLVSSGEVSIRGINGYV